MVDFISTMPLLLIFLISWIISFAALLFLEDSLYKAKAALLSAIFSLFIIVESSVEVRIVADPNVITGTFGVFPILELAYSHMILFVMALILMFYYYTLSGISILENKKG